MPCTFKNVNVNCSWKYNLSREEASGQFQPRLPFECGPELIILTFSTLKFLKSNSRDQHVKEELQPDCVKAAVALGEPTASSHHDPEEGI